MRDSIENIIGDYGEKIVKERLNSISDPIWEYNIMEIVKGQRHFYDLNIQKWRLNFIKHYDNSITKIDVKTFKPLRNDPNGTGINKSHWFEYLQIDELLILFVDPQNHKIYGDFVYNLKNNYYTLPTSKKEDRIIFKIDKMKKLDELFPNSIGNLTDIEILNFNRLYNHSKIFYILPSQLLNIRKKLQL